jgi:hypothetical protein
MNNITLSRKQVEQWLEDLEYSDSDKNVIAALKQALAAEIEKLKREMLEREVELTQVYGLLAMAHLNIKQHLQYGFNPATAHSTLISVGRYYPRLKAEMERENDDDL